MMTYIVLYIRSPQTHPVPFGPRRQDRAAPNDDGLFYIINIMLIYYVYVYRPILFLSGRADEIVPPYMMTALYRAATRSAGRCGAS